MFQRDIIIIQGRQLSYQSGTRIILNRQDIEKRMQYEL
jgi:hypothetical protein